MIPRHQLPVSPRISAGSLLRGALAAAGPTRSALDGARDDLRRTFEARECTLTDSGTSALVLALRLTAGATGTVALPGYGCVDFASAVRFAGMRVRLYDVDPATLSPDLDSVGRVLARGVDAIVVAHLYGYPADVPAVRALATRAGVPLVEDAAQAAGGTLGGHRLGSLGDLSVLSFGRGKGLYGGRGGALLGFSPEWADAMRGLDSPPPRRGVREAGLAAAQWALGRPGVYALPASLPWLRLGDMVYHPAHEPMSLSAAAATLVRVALASESTACDERRRVARRLWRASAGPSCPLSPVHAVTGGHPGFLRFAVMDRAGERRPHPRLGVMRGYPRTLREQPELRPSLLDGEPATPGAAALRASLFTLPTHPFVSERDLVALEQWLVGRRPVS